MSNPQPDRPTIPLAKQDVNVVEVKPIEDKTERVSPWNFMFAVQRNPCFRQSFLWGIGVGAAMAGHSAIRHRNQHKAINAAVATFLVVSTGSWVYCRSAQREEEKRMRQLVKVLAEKQAAGADAADAASTVSEAKR